MPNGSRNTTTIQFKDNKSIVIEDILGAYAFREDDGTDATDQIHPLLVDKRLRHLPKHELAKFYNIMFNFRFEEAQKNVGSGVLHKFVTLKGSTYEDTCMIVVDEPGIVDGVLDKFKKKTYEGDLFRAEELIEKTKEGCNDFFGFWDENMVNDGRDYAIGTIGTKGSFPIEDEYEDPDMLSFGSETAGSPPEAFLQTLADDLGVNVHLSADIEGEEGIHADDCLEEGEANGEECKYEYDYDMCRPNYYEETFNPRGGK